MEQHKFDQLEVKACNSIQEMGKAAAEFAIEVVNQAIYEKNSARIILATGASQFTFLDSLKAASNISWEKIKVFHLDEYLGMPNTHPASFRRYLKERILDYVGPGKTNFLAGDAGNIEEELERYSNLLKEAPIDLACIGIGENGHIAFNDPPVADFKDPVLVKKVELDEICRKQQLGEGWFTNLNEVPTHALTLTIPAIMRSKGISCVVPDKRKVQAVRGTLFGPVSETCPASILRTHKNAVLWLDENSAAGLKA